ncbi:hypothetical protein AG1IA_10225 [Rhizoctonia solani AG-1 IA]|uniref:Uncharacterized protein n=1 Tax=Thanatephorus cucumeris (strain AG1-IA) TaxID=983506 RepID=L8WCS1_THACA|nr:hypothetical protein AG1IA_10225 [Rhizoctonia solani AG-1 IA]
MRLCSGLFYLYRAELERCLIMCSNSSRGRGSFGHGYPEQLSAMTSDQRFELAGHTPSLSVLSHSSQPNYLLIMNSFTGTAVDSSSSKFTQTVIPPARSDTGTSYPDYAPPTYEAATSLPAPSITSRSETHSSPDDEPSTESMYVFTRICSVKLY